MKAGRHVEILNPYEWLPGYGENSVSLFTEGLDLIVVIDYDSPSGAPQKKELQFKNVCAFYKGVFPGPHMLNLDYGIKSTVPILGNLIEFPDSEAALSWMQHFENSRLVRHYKIVFLAENLMLEIFGGEVVLRDVTLGQ